MSGHGAYDRYEWTVFANLERVNPSRVDSGRKDSIEDARNAAAKVLVGVESSRSDAEIVRVRWESGAWVLVEELEYGIKRSRDGRVVWESYHSLPNTRQAP